MIIVTGAAGFVGSCMATYLHQQGLAPLVLVDDFSRADKLPNLEHLPSDCERVDRNSFFGWFLRNAEQVKFVIHLGARTDTTEKDWAIFEKLNLTYSQHIFQLCFQYQIPLIYASSAATYGLGERGYDDSIAATELRPLNPYGKSKNDFDAWVMEQVEEGEVPPFWAGLKFFNVYGVNEYHKGRMASVVWHTFNQIRETGKMRLFRSHNEAYKDGEQKRDFVYVKDVCSVIRFLMRKRPNSGIYNLGTGVARTFVDLATATFKALGKEPVIEFMDTPVDIRDTYQYFTQAAMEKLVQAGYTTPFHTLEEGVEDYVKNYLVDKKYF